MGEKLHLNAHFFFIADKNKRGKEGNLIMLPQKIKYSHFRGLSTNISCVSSKMQLFWFGFLKKKITLIINNLLFQGKKFKRSEMDITYIIRWLERC